MYHGLLWLLSFENIAAFSLGGGVDIFNAAGNAAVSLKRVPFESFNHNLCLLISENFNEVHKSFPVNKNQSYKKNLTFPGHKFKKRPKPIKIWVTFSLCLSSDML